MARDELCEARDFIITTQAANDIEPPAAAAPQRANSQKQNIKIDPCRDGQGGGGSDNSADNNAQSFPSSPLIRHTLSQSIGGGHA